MVARAGVSLLYDTGGEEVGHVFNDSHPFLAGGAAFGVPVTPGVAPPGNDGSRLGVPVSAFDPRLKLPYTLRWHVESARSEARTPSRPLTSARPEGVCS